MRTSLQMVVIAGVMFVAGLGMVHYRNEANPAPPTWLLSPDSILNQEVTLVDGARTTVRELVGEVDTVTAMVVFSLACGSCYAEALRWRDMRQMHGEWARFIAIVVGDNHEQARSFARRADGEVMFAITSPRAAMAMGIRSVPTALVLSSGTVVFTAEGVTATADLDHWLSSRRVPNPTGR